MTKNIFAKNDNVAPRKLVLLVLVLFLGLGIVGGRLVVLLRDELRDEHRRPAQEGQDAHREAAHLEEQERQERLREAELPE